MTKIKNPQNARHLEHNDGQGRDIARKGTVAKKCNDGPVPHHPGMSSLARGGAGSGGMGHPTATINDGGQTIATSAAASPLAHAYSVRPDLKTGTPAAPPVPGQKSQTNIGIESHADKCKTGVDTLSSAVKC
jgi:hypothetical protein